MERVIKFRGISLDTNKWVYGYAAFDSTFEYAVIINKQSSNEMQKWAVDPKTVMQFTGLTDKNGKEIWSKDIAKDELGNLYIVEYSGFEIFPFFSGSPDRATLLPNQVEIIGNVHEHPHLIK